MDELKTRAVGERMSGDTRSTALPEPSIAQLLSSLIDDAQTLVRREVDLAKAEITGEIAKARRGAIMLGAGAGAAIIGLACLIVALAEALTAFNLLDRWLAYLTVGGICVIAGGIMLAMGIQRFQQIDPIPYETIDSIEKDISWLSGQSPSDKT